MFTLPRALEFKVIFGSYLSAQSELNPIVWMELNHTAVKSADNWVARPLNRQRVLETYPLNTIKLTKRNLSVSTIGYIYKILHYTLDHSWD